MANQVNKDAIVRFLAGYETDLSKAKIENGTVYFALKPDPLDSTKTIGSIYVDADGKRILMSGESLAILDAMGEKILTKYIKSVDFGSNTGAQGKLTYTKGDGSDVDINVPSASATAAGFVTTGAQTFAGIKTFNNPLIPLQGSYIHQAPGTAGSSGYVKMATFKISGSYQNVPIIIELVDRVRKGSCVLNIQFQNVNSSDPALATFTYEGVDYNCYMHKSATSTWDLYVQKGEAHGYPTVVRFHKAPYMSKVAITWTNVHAEAAPSGATKAVLGGNVAYASKAGSADTATKDGSGNNIQTTYLKDITSQTSTSDFKFWGLKGNGGDGTVITVPAATNALAGLMTTGDQTFAGVKTFAGFVYGGMSKSTANAARKLWFMSSTTGTPTYSDDLTYNPSTKTLVAPYVTGLATQATGDGQGNEILTTYLKDIAGTSSTTKYTIKGILGSGGDSPTTVEIPAATTSVAGLVTTGTQTFNGSKTFKTFRYSGIKEDTALTTAQPIWFQSATSGRPVYNSDLTYTPSTNTLKATNFDGLASKATADGNGTNIRDNYLTGIENTNTDKHILTAVKGNGGTIDIPLGFVLKAGDTMTGQLKLTGGLWVNTSTATKPIIIDRTGAGKETATIYQNDTGLNFELLNDEATSGIYFKFAATDDEANAGAGAFTDKTASIVANKSGVTITANNFSGLASKATADSAGNNILDKYISSIAKGVHTANSFTIKAYDGNGNDQSEVSLPVDTTGALASLIINGAQTLVGVKTFSSGITISNKEFRYTGIEQGTANADRVVWFADSGEKGKPVYHSEFVYNPSTKTLKVANITGTVTNATKDSAGNVILDKYLSTLAITSHTATAWAFTAYNGRGTDVVTINAPIDTTGALATLVINGAQTFKGSKTFESDVVLSGANTNLQKAGSSVSWYQGRDSAIIKTTSYSGYNAAYSLKTTDGAWSAGVYNDNILYWSYVTDTNYNAKTNTKTADMSLNASGRLSVPSILASTRIAIGSEDSNYGLYNAKTTYLVDTVTTLAATNLAQMATFVKDTVKPSTNNANRSALTIYGQTYGNDSTYIKTAGVLSYGDPGPQIIFSTSANHSGASIQSAALIFTDHDTIATGTSLSLVSNQTNVSFIAPTIRARTALVVDGTTSLTGALTAHSTALFKGAATFENTVGIQGDVTLEKTLYVKGAETVDGVIYAKNDVEVTGNVIITNGNPYIKLVESDKAQTHYVQVHESNLYFGPGAGASPWVDKNGVLNTIGAQYADSRSGGLNLNNSDIYGANSIYTADLADDAREGLHFYRGTNTVDTLWVQNGLILFYPNRTISTTVTPTDANNRIVPYTSTRNGNVGSYIIPTYIEGGIIKAFSSTIGGALRPIFMQGGAIVQCDQDLGDIHTTLATTTKAYILGTTNSATGFADTGYFDTGVYLTTTAGQLSSATFVSRSSLYAGSNIYLRNGTSGTYARLFVNKAGTASATEGTAGTTGETILYLGNSTATSTTAGSGANNAKGYLRLYGSNTSYGQISYSATDTSSVNVYISRGGTLITNNIASSTGVRYFVGVSAAADTGASVNTNTSIYATGSILYGAAWNDYAEYRRTSEKVEPGRVVIETGRGDLKLSTERLQPGANVVSDTFGFAIGQTKKAKTPLAVAGRVLVYTFEDRYSYEPGDAVCTGPNGTVSKMTREEIWKYPERIVGTVSEIPNYDVWESGDGPLKVNGRIWIKVK